MSPAALRIEVTEDPDLLPAAWDTLALHRSVLLSRAYLQTLLRSRPANSTYRCAWAFSDETLVAVAVFHIIPLELARLDPALSRLPAAVRHALTLLETQQRHATALAFCGNVLHTDAPGFACHPDLPPEPVLHALTEAARASRAPPARLVLLKEVDVPGGRAGTALHEDGYQLLDVLQPSMELRMDTAWTSWEGYLGALRKKYRQRARAARVRAEGLTRTRHAGVDWLHHAPAMDRLLRPVLDRADLALVPITTETLKALATGLGNHVVVHTYTERQRLLGFGLGILDGAVLHAMLVGVDPDANSTHRLYQNLLYDFVEEGIRQRVETLALGRTAMEIKSAVGAEAVSLAVFLRHDGLLQPLLVAAARQVGPPAWTPRHALRSPPSGPTKPPGEGLG